MATVALAAALLAGGSAVGDTARGADRTCLAKSHAGNVTCAVEPQRFNLDRGVSVRSIRWEFWGPAKEIRGVGRVESAGNADGARARVKVSHVETCGRSLWFTRVVVRYPLSADSGIIKKLYAPTPCE